MAAWVRFQEQSQIGREEKQRVAGQYDVEAQGVLFLLFFNLFVHILSPLAYQFLGLVGTLHEFV